MRKIMVPLDGSELSERALERAQEFAGVLGAEIVLVRVLEPLPTVMVGVGPAVPLHHPGESREELQDYLQQWRQKIPVQTTAFVEDGDPAEKIAERAKSEQVDIIIMSSHGRRGLSRVALGSVAERVLHRSPCAVMVLPAAIWSLKGAGKKESS